jgi:hypothetical protein
VALFRSTAFSFHTSFSLAEMLSRLDGVGGHRWIERSRDSWGDYISSITQGPGERDKTRMRIISPDDVDGWVLDLQFASEEPDAEARLERFLAFAKDTVLTVVDGSRVREVDDYSE